MTIGLDLGSHEFRSMRSDSHHLIARSCPAVFVTIADTPAHRRLLLQSRTQFVTCADHLLVVGDAAQEWSEMLNLPLIPLLKGGRVPTSDVIARQILTLMIDAMLPASVPLGELCCMTVPGGNDRPGSDRNDAGFFSQMVSLRGYRPQIVTATRALVLAELNDASFTGIAITFGHATCEFGVNHCGREILRCVVATGLEEFEGSEMFGASTSQPQKQAASSERSYSRYFTEVIEEAREQFDHDGTLKTLPQPLPVICAGSITRTPSFLPMLQRIWNESNWNIATHPIRCASDPIFAVARGCLIQAELEQPSQRHVA